MDTQTVYRSTVSQIVGREREIRLIVAALGAGRDLLLEGPPGTSKSTILRTITIAERVPLYFVEGNADLTPAKLIGQHSPSRVLQEDYGPQSFTYGPLPLAMREGGFLYIEEFNRVPEDTLNTLLTAMAGLSTAYATNSPVLCIAGQIQSDLIGRGRGVLHEIPNQLTAVRSVTKWAAQALDPTEVPDLVATAFRELATGRPRPVEIEIPPDILQRTAPVTLPDVAVAARTAGDPDLLEMAARALGQAERPLIFVGGGVLQAGAWAELQTLAELLEAPVVMSSSGKGALSSRHYLAQTMIAAGSLLPSSDVVLVVGTRFTQPPSASWGPTKDQTVIQLDADMEEIGRNYPPSIGIVADAKLGLAELADRVGKHNRVRASREDELRALQAKVDDLLFEIQPQASYALALREELPDDGILVGEMTQVGYWANQGYPVYEPRTYITPGYQGTLGFGFPTALGAQVGNPTKRVVSINGDGGFLYNVQELATAAMHGINVVAVVFNDNAFGNVKRIQKDTFGGHYLGSDLLNPDFMRLAEAFGIAGIRANGPEGLRAALREAFDAVGPVLIEVPVDEMPSMWSVLSRALR